MTKDDGQVRTAWPMRFLRGMAASVFVTIALLAVGAMTSSRFVPTAAGLILSIAITIVLGAGAAALAFFNPFNARDSASGAMPPNSSLPLSRTNRTVAAGVVMMLFGFPACNGALLELCTLAFGKPGQMIMHVSGYSSGNRSRCSGYDLREAWFAERRLVCLSYSSAAAAPAGTPVVLSGAVSPWGIVVSSYELKAPPLQ